MAAFGKMLVVIRQGRMTLLPLKCLRTVSHINACFSSSELGTANEHYYSGRSLETLFNKYQDIELTPLHVRYLEFGRCFLNAQISVSQYYVDEKRNIVNPKLVSYPENKNMTGFYLDFLPLFEEMKDRMQYVELAKTLCDGDRDDHSRGSQLRKRRHFLLQAFRSLDNFLKTKEHHEKCLSSMVENKIADEYSEFEITALLATHLFSPLVSSSPVGNFCEVTNDDSQFKRSKCLCGGPCDAIVTYGNTGFGSEYLWYGTPDIMLYPVGGGTMVIFRPKDSEMEEEDENYSEHTYRQITDMNGDWNELRTERSVQQIVSQAITFSFLRNKYRKKMKVNPVVSTLIPVIFASSHYFDVYMYDMENDILLRNLGDPIPIFERLCDGKHPGFEFESRLNLDAIVQIWMLINHLLLQPKFRPDQIDVLKNTCGIRRQIDSSNLMDRIMKTMSLKPNFTPKPIEEHPAFTMNKV